MIGGAKLVNAMAALTGEKPVVEMSDNEAMVKCVTRVAAGVVIIVTVLGGGCTYFNANEQTVRRMAIEKGYIRAVTVDGQIYMKPECRMDSLDYRGSTGSSQR